MGFELEGRGFSESLFLHVFTFSVKLTINLVFPIQMLHFKMVSAVQNDFSIGWKTMEKCNQLSKTIISGCIEQLIFDVFQLYH